MVLADPLDACERLRNAESAGKASCYKQQAEKAVDHAHVFVFKIVLQSSDDERESLLLHCVPGIYVFDVCLVHVVVRVMDHSRHICIWQIGKDFDGR